MKTNLRNFLKPACLLRPLLLLVWLPFILLCPAAVSAQDVREEWARRYVGALPSEESSVLLAVDQSGNSYVTGNSFSNSIGNHIVTVKYSPDGEELWSKRFSAGYNDSVHDIAVDAAGDVYIVGSSMGSFNRRSLLGIKYSGTDGTELWSFHDGPGMDSYATTVKVDMKGGVFISGASLSTRFIPYNTDLLMKFDAADGTQLWVKSFSDAGEAAKLNKMFGFDLDDAGDVYVSGTTGETAVSQDIVTIKYNGSDGAEEWFKVYNSGKRDLVSGIAVDNAGGVFVTGTAGGTEAFLLKYRASEGDQVWIQQAMSSSSSPIKIRKLLTDHKGGVYVAGTIDGEELVIRLATADGEIEWIEPVAGTVISLATDNTDELYIARAGTQGNYVISRYKAATGEQLWQQNSSNSSGFSENAASLIIGKSGGLYLAGVSRVTSSEESSEIFLARHDAATGNQLWKSRFTGEAPTSANPLANITDKAGNVYVLGLGRMVFKMVDNAVTNINTAVLVKYSPEGEELWSTFFTANQVVSDIKVDESGGVYISGTTQGILFTSKYNSINGEQLWISMYDIGGNAAGYSSALTIDHAGGVYITGSDLTTGGIITIKYQASNGEQVWVANYEQGSLARDIAIKDGYVFVTGDSYVEVPDENSDFDITLLKYNAANGSQVWEKHYDSFHSDFASQLVVDSKQGIYILGQSMTSFTGTTSVLLKFNTETGDLEWIVIPEEQIAEITTDKAEGLYGTGQYETSLITLKWNARDGNQVWLSRYETGFPEGQLNLGASQTIAADGMGGIYITGLVTDGLVTVKYDASDGTKNWDVLREFSPTQVEGPLPAAGLTLDKDLHVIVTWYDINTTNGVDMITVKYSQSTPACYTPVQARLYLPTTARKVGQQVRTTADFGQTILTETTGVRWTWGDGGTSSLSYTALGTARITGEHTYTQAGVYRVGLDFSQSCLKPENEGYEQWQVVYDPGAGSVIGAGYVDYAARSHEWMGMAGSFNYAFGVWYNSNSAQAPSGHMLLLQNQQLFRSSSLEWLVISGDKAIWKGEGTYNGSGRYGFIVSASDAGGTGLNDRGDRLRIRIWDMNRSNRIVFDNFDAGGEIMDMEVLNPTIARGQVIIYRGDGAISAALTAMSDAELDISEKGHFYAYPNTFSISTTISFALELDQPYELALYDIKGALVRRMGAGTAEAGKVYQLSLDGQNLPEGIYVARMLTASGSQSIKLLLKR